MLKFSNSLILFILIFSLIFLSGCSKKEPVDICPKYSGKVNEVLYLAAPSAIECIENNCTVVVGEYHPNEGGIVHSGWYDFDCIKKVISNNS